MPNFMVALARREVIMREPENFAKLNLSNYYSAFRKRRFRSPTRPEAARARGEHGMPEPLRIQQIRQFVITATTGSFRAAATGTFRSQAAVSAAMRDLERQVGAKLFEQGRRAKLTPVAQTLLPIFNELLNNHDRVLTDIRQVAQAERGSVSLAVVPVLAEEWLPTLLADLVRDHPNVRIRATDQRSPQVRALVADGTVDIGIAGRLADDPKLDFQPVATDPFGVLCYPGHPLAQRRRAVPWKALRGERLIGNDSIEQLKGKGIGDGIDAPVLEVTSRVTLMACVKAELGITVVPMLTRAEKALGLVFIPLTAPRITRTLGIVTRRGQTMLPIIARIRERIFSSLRAYARGQGATVFGAAEGAARRPHGRRG
jgi:DNA-binding transcriptional LysR family regulator